MGGAKEPAEGSISPLASMWKETVRPGPPVRASAKQESRENEMGIATHTHREREGGERREENREKPSQREIEREENKEKQREGGRERREQRKPSEREREREIEARKRRDAGNKHRGQGRVPNLPAGSPRPQSSDTRPGARCA